MNDCTCGGTTPDHPMHEDFCGRPERADDCTCGYVTIDPACTVHGHMVAADKCPDCLSVTIAHDLRCPVIAA